MRLHDHRTERAEPSAAGADVRGERAQQLLDGSRDHRLASRIGDREHDDGRLG